MNTVTNRIPASEIQPGDLVIHLGTFYRVTSVEPSPSGKIVDFWATVEHTDRHDLAIGRQFRFGRRAATLIPIIDTQPLG